jgi:hypothetical protein
VVGTYGRGVWTTNIATLQQLSRKVMTRPFHLFDIKPKPVSYTSPRAWWGNYQMTGDAHLRTPNQMSGLTISYYLKEKLPQPLKIEIKDVNYKEINSRKLKNSPGIHRFNWVPRNRQSGVYRFILTDGINKIEKTGTLLPPLKFPVGNPDQYRQFFRHF